MLEAGKIYRLKCAFMSEPEWFIVTDITEVRYGVKYQLLLRTDFMLSGNSTWLSDHWLCSEAYVNRLVENGEMVLEN